jgi:ergothioneine biosynthesis protein EgtB
MAKVATTVQAMPEPSPSSPSRSSLHARYRDIRQRSEQYCAPLNIEDYGLQAVAETSPAKWHLAHTSWFFETFLLKPYVADYTPFHPRFEYLFNSYYNGIGEQFPRAQRGLLSRPTVEEVYVYRHAVDDAMAQLFGKQVSEEIATRVELGLQHEMQHQELFFTDLKYNLAQSPLHPVYLALETSWQTAAEPSAIRWHDIEGGIRLVGSAKMDAIPNNDFCFDNETPQHRVLVEPFSLADRPLNNGEVLAFVEDGGYRNAALWLADGWAKVRDDNWQHPLYWQLIDDRWYEFTLHGLQPLDLSRPACHLSAYEADALARWYGARLPTEFEWEVAANDLEKTNAQMNILAGQFVDHGHYHPKAEHQQSLYGGIWQWTSSAYSPYRGYQAAAGAIGEYNGKFMCNQLVLRGGSCVSDRRQLRASYRNFFYPADRWQFSGVRIAKDRRD